MIAYTAWDCLRAIARHYDADLSLDSGTRMRVLAGYPRGRGRLVRRIELPWETWRAVIDVRRAEALPSMLEHADRLEQ